jgi:peptidoglycan hydrolase-like protein with peptidoglycan-binding domain
MTFRRIATACVAFSLVAVPAERVMADGDALVGGIVGGIIGGVIVNEANKSRAKKKTYSTSSSKKTYSSSSGISSAQREQNREVQTALNYFGFPVGTPDGAIGPKSRAAISEYQATMGFPATGQLNDFERDILVSSYYRAQSGGAATATLMATNPRGAKGVLIAWKDERLGIGTPQGTLAGGTGLGAATFAAPVAAGAVVTPAMPTFQAAPVVPALPVAAAPALPQFLAQGGTQVSLATLCSQVAVTTSTNGGYMTQLNMTDPTLALSEQFCVARTYAMAQSDEMVAKIAGFTPQQIAEQCAGFAPVMKDHVAAISVKPRADVVDGVLGFVTNSGMAPAQLAGTAKVCLGIGYKVDNTELALGSALILGVMGERAYGELVGHHLAQGIGASARPDLALGWFEAALGDPGEPIVQIFAPQMPDRAGLIRMAAYARAGQPMPGGSIPAFAPAPAEPAAALPAFGAETAAVPEAAPALVPAPAPAPAPAAQPDTEGGFGFKIPFLSNP